MYFSMCVICTGDMLVWVMRCIDTPVSHGLNSCTHAETLSYRLFYNETGVGFFLYLWELRDGKPLKLYPIPLVLYQAFLSLVSHPIKSLSPTACVYVSNISVALISLSLCTSLLFYPFPLFSVICLAVLSISSSLTSSHSSLIYPVPSACPTLHFPHFNLLFLQHFIAVPA